AYNRYGYALIGLLLVESVASCDLLARRDERWGGVSTGAILAILLFLKISYFVGAVFLTVALIPCRKQVRDRWAGMFCGFAALFAAFWAYLGFDLAPMWNDLHMVAGAKRAKLNWFIVNNLYLSVSFYLAFIIGAARFLAVRRAPAPARRVLIAGLAVCMAGIFLLSTNFQFYGLPLSAVMAILVLQEIGPRFAAGHSKTMAHA